MALSYRHFTLSLAFTTTDSEMEIQSPYGSYPGFVSLMRRDFNRADEDAWQVGIAYDFARLGLDGLSAFAYYAEGYGARDSETRKSLPNQREFNITADYKPNLGFLTPGWHPSDTHIGITSGGSVTAISAPPIADFPTETSPP